MIDDDDLVRRFVAGATIEELAASTGHGPALITNLLRNRLCVARAPAKGIDAVISDWAEAVIDSGISEAQAAELLRGKIRKIQDLEEERSS